MGRTVDDVRTWLADATHLVHVSVLVFLPLVIYAVIELRSLSHISYFVFPPLASATFTVFFDPDGTYSTAPRLVGGLTLGAVVGWACVQLFGFGGIAAGTAVLLTGVVTWPLHLEHPSAFSTALLAVVLRADSLLYIGAVFVSTAFVAALFLTWRRYVYEERARYLYAATRDEDRVLVPIRDPADRDVARICGRIAGAHDDGRMVLLTVDGSDVNALADEIGEEYDVRVETASMYPQDDAATTVLDAADRHDCTLIGVPLERGEDGFSPFIETLFDRASQDVIVCACGEDTGPWNSAFVPVKSAGKLSRLMVEIGMRVVDAGTVSATTIIGRERDRRRAEKQLFNLVSAFSDEASERSDLLDTRIIDAGEQDVSAVIAETGAQYGVTMIGASTDRPFISRLITPPTVASVLDALEEPFIVVHSAEAARSRVKRLIDRATRGGWRE